MMRPGPAVAAPALVAAGSAVGAVARVLVGWLATALLDDATWVTVGVNILGCLGIGVAAGVVARHPAAGRWWPLIGPGLLGGFTTFSAFIVALDGLRPVHAMAVIVVTLGLCPIAAWCGETAVTRAR